jgi:hypothetical integral membrane protein (TIGR02206 family)
VVVAFLLVAIALVILGRSSRDARSDRALDRGLAITCFVVWIIINGWWLVPRNFDLSYSLPLHVCDITCLVAPLVLIWPARWLRAILYFWGIGLSLQGFIQPDLRDGPARLGFWFFWANHFVVVGIAVYDLARGYRPGWRDLGIAVGATLVYLAIILPIDILWSLNYGYVGPAKPSQPTLIDHLGPWPWRVFALVGLAWAVMAVMVLPWVARCPRRAPS